MPGWGKLVAGALIGVAGTVYATNEELRKKLPGAARDLPVAVRRRLENAVSAGRAASSERRQEILRDLEHHGGQHPIRDITPDEAPAETAPETDEPAAAAPEDTTPPAEHGKQDEQD